IDPPKAESFLRYDRSELDQSIPNRFEKIVALYPDRLAVKAGSRQLTYDELNRSANRVAHALLKQCGEVQEGVGLLVEDECQAVVAILGVLKSGHFYVPLDPSFPSERLSALLNDGQIRMILTENKHLRWAQELGGRGCTVICIDSLDGNL